MWQLKCVCLSAQICSDVSVYLTTSQMCQTTQKFQDTHTLSCSYSFLSRFFLKCPREFLLLSSSPLLCSAALLSSSAKSFPRGAASKADLYSSQRHKQHLFHFFAIHVMLLLMVLPIQTLKWPRWAISRKDSNLCFWLVNGHVGSNFKTWLGNLRRPPF